MTDETITPKVIRYLCSRGVGTDQAEAIAKAIVEAARENFHAGHTSVQRRSLAGKGIAALAMGG
jgi:hypothetical protein